MQLRALSTTACRALRKPQFDVKGISGRLEAYLHSIKARQLLASPQLSAELQNLPKQENELKLLNQQFVRIQTARKDIEREIKEDKSKMLQSRHRLQELKTEAQAVAADLKHMQDKVQETCMSLPNLIHGDVPLTEPQVLQWLSPQSEFRPDPKRDHHDIMVRKELVDFRSAATVTGNSWYYLINDGALLEQALVSYATKKARDRGFIMCNPPSIAKNEVIDACGFRPRDMNGEQQIYHLADTQWGLTATAEIALAGLGIDAVLDLSRGSRKLCGVSRSYRAEAGARGKDTRGLYRVHEFTKVELFCWARPDDSDQMLEELRQFQTELVEELGLPAKVLNMPANDLGAPAYRKYDIEVWMPGRGSFGEITSTSNCTDFQSRRMNTKFKDPVTGKSSHVHTLNGTAMAVPRVIVALVENFYDPVSNLIAVPAPLVPYMDGKTHI